jgi:predicted permease
MTPPRIARAWLGRLLPAAHRTAILSDLDEEFARHIAPTRSRRRAQWWYWRQAVLSTPFALRLRVRARRPVPPGARGGLAGGILADLRFAARLHGRRPAMPLVITLSLGAGIAVTTASLSLAHAVLLRPLPYVDPDRLVHVGERDLRSPAAAAAGRNVSWPDFVDFRDRQRTFTALAGYSGGSRTLTGMGPAERVTMAEVTPEFFRVLGVQPQHGRDFRPEDADSAAPLVVMLTDGAWRRRFGGDPTVIGMSISLAGQPAAIVGVLPKDFHFPLRGLAELWLPIRPTRAQIERRYFHWLNVIGRLRPETTAEQAAADLTAVAAGFAAVDPRYHASAAASVERLDAFVVGDVRQMLIVLFGASCLVLLIACTNAAGLLAAQAASRVREISVRSALGATRWRLLQSIFLESAALVVPAAIAGLLGGFALLRAFVATIPDAQRASLPHLETVALDPVVVAWTIGAAAAAASAFGLALAARLRHATAGATTRGSLGLDRHGGKLQRGFVIAQVALTLVLLTGAGLMGRTVIRLLSVSPGFSPDNLLTMRVNLSGARYGTPDAVRGFHRDLIAAIAAMPGVDAVSSISQPPLTGPGNSGSFAVEAQPDVEDRSTRIRTVAPNYFGVMGLPVVGGRAFSADDGPDGSRVLVVNETFARQLFEGRPLGQRIAFPFFAGRPFWTIVGVVADEQVAGLGDPMRPVAYFPFAQTPDSEFTLMVRTAGDPEPVVAAARARMADLDPDQPLFGARTLSEIITTSDAVFRRRTVLSLIGIFAAAALVLTLVGLYAIVSQAVAERTREIGVRVTLGARPRHIVAGAMRQGLAPATLGLVAGGAASVAAAPLLGSLLYGVEPTDPATLIGVAMALALVAAAACLIPASRASRIDPVAALRRE